MTYQALRGCRCVSVFLCLAIQFRGAVAQTSAATFMGGEIKVADGGATLTFSPSRRIQSVFHLVTFQGSAAWVLPTAAFYGAGPKQRESYDGNFVFTKDSLIFNPVSGSEWRYDEKYAMPDKIDLLPKIGDSIYPRALSRFGPSSDPDERRPELTAPGMPTLIVWLLPTKELQGFLDSLSTDFSGTTERFIQAAMLAGSPPQFALVTKTEATKMIQQKKEAAKEAGKAYDREHGTSGMDTFRALAAGTLQAAQPAIAAGRAQGRGDTATASRMQAESQATFSSAIGGSNSNATAVGAASTSGGSSASYTGSESQWVTRLLNTGGTYSCTPEKPPAHAASYTCQRDATVAKARAVAWAVECSAEKGDRTATDQYVSLMMTTLKSAGALCAAGNSPRCDSDAQFSCAELPR